MLEPTSVLLREPPAACLGYRDTLTVPATPAAARTEESDLADQLEHQHAQWANLGSDKRFGCREPTISVIRNC